MNHIEVNYDIASDVFLFLKNYSNVHGMPSPGRHFNEISMPVVFLPTSFSYSSVYRDYVQAYKEKHEPEIHVMAESTFVKIWKSLIPLLQFMSPKSNLCENCETMKMDIQYTTQYEKKLDFTENYLNHLKRAQQERDYHNSNIACAIKDGKNNPNSSESQTLYKTFKGVTHIAYDWTQNVQIPYSPQQIEPLFFKSPWKVHIFGVCNTGNFPHTQQINYIIDEGEMPDDGKQGKGVNCTLSLVLHAIQKYNRGEKKLIVTCVKIITLYFFIHDWLIVIYMMKLNWILWYMNIQSLFVMGALV
jgi:hypothetical protein